MLKRPQALVPSPGTPPLARLRGTAAAVGELTRSPASGTPCAHWRLRIFETLGPSLDLVHEVMADEPFAVSWRPDPLLPPRRVQLSGDRLRLQAQPILHREGSPGARAVSEHFGLQGRVRVEEVLIRQGDDLEAEGRLFDPAAPPPAEGGAAGPERGAGGLSPSPAGPYRASQGEPQLFEATIRLPTGIALRPALLPWALGTAAALMGAATAASAVSKLWKMRLDVVTSAEIGPAKPRRPVWP